MTAKDEIKNYIKAVISRHDALLNEKFATKQELNLLAYGGDSAVDPDDLINDIWNNAGSSSAYSDNFIDELNDLFN